MRHETIPYFENAPSSIYQGRDFNLGNAYRLLGGVLLEKGDYYEANRALEVAQDYGRRSGDGRHGAITCQMMARVQAALGMQGESLGYACESVKLSREYDDRVGLCVNLFTLGHLLLKAGDTTDARRAGQESLALTQDMGNPNLHCWAAVRLGAVELAEGHLHRASQLANDALDRYRREGLDGPGLLAEILLLQGRCAQAAGDLECAVTLFRQALALPDLTQPMRLAAEDALAALA